LKNTDDAVRQSENFLAENYSDIFQLQRILDDRRASFL